MSGVWGGKLCACESRGLSLVKPPEPRRAWRYSEVLDRMGDASYQGKHAAEVES
ncbi:MAG TPA: hypothetical protein VJ782_02175 [Aeromicrobium sp.]|nr:hypothetical protein [Aeromicrobium sp.]